MSSILNGRNSRGGGGGNQQQMMMGVSVSSVCFISVLVIAAGVMMYYKGSGTTGGSGKDGGPTIPDVPTPDTPTGSGPVSAGRYMIKYGGVSMINAKSSCSDDKVYFKDSQENDRHLWNLEPVPGNGEYFYISSENKLFKKGCSKRFLTAPKECNGGANLQPPNYADRQYWKLVSTGSGADGYQLQNVACLNKRKPSYLISSGSKSGSGNTAKLTSRAGAPYTFTSSSNSD